MKIGLKQEEKKEGIVVEALLDSSAMIISEKFARKNKFRRTNSSKIVS